MKTTKEKREIFRKGVTMAAEIQSTLCDEIDTLENGLSEATALLKAARVIIVQDGNQQESETWLSDLERFTKGLE